MNRQADPYQRLLAEQGDVRTAALAELLETQSDVSSHIEKIAACIGDPEEPVRFLTLQLLARAGAPAVEYFALSLTRQQTESFRAVAAAMLAAMGPPAVGAVRGLCRCLISADETLRNAATVALVKIGAEAVPSLQLILTTSSPDAVAAAVEAITWIGRPAQGIAPEVQALAARSPVPLQLACAAALSSITGDPGQGLPVLIKALENPDRLIRKTAVEKIATLGDVASPAMPNLLRCIADQDENVRAAAVLTLGRIRAPHSQTVPGVAARLTDPSAEVRYAAVVVLAGYGTNARPVLEILRTCLHDPSEKVAKCAAGAIKMIESSSP